MKCKLFSHFEIRVGIFNYDDQGNLDGPSIAGYESSANTNMDFDLFIDDYISDACRENDVVKVYVEVLRRPKFDLYQWLWMKLPYVANRLVWLEWAINYDGSQRNQILEQEYLIEVSIPVGSHVEYDIRRFYSLDDCLSWQKDYYPDDKFKLFMLVGESVHGVGLVPPPNPKMLKNIDTLDKAGGVVNVDGK